LRGVVSLEVREVFSFVSLISVSIVSSNSEYINVDE
jgi:hypothetical protein